MKAIFRLNFLPLLVLLFTTIAQGQAIETTYNWFPNSHSTWKVQPNSPTGYVMMGNKFFTSGNTSMYAQGFDETGAPLWLGKYTATGFSGLQTFWKSFTLSSSSPVRYFAVAQGTLGGASKAYALLINGQGQKVWDRVSDLPSGFQFGGVTNASNGGWIATGGNNSGNLITVKFDLNGNIQWIKNYLVSGFGWAILATPDGGYLIGSTTLTVTKINKDGNQVWSTSIPLPLSPDGSAYTYSEFEEIIGLPAGNDGVIITGSIFSNQTSAVYSARVRFDGTVAWKTVHNPVNTGLPGTPVSWINNAIVDDPYSIVTSWRNGPVSSGGTLYYQRQNYNGGLINAANSMNNTIPVQEAFLIKAHDKYVVAGVRGGYSTAYSWIHTGLPIPGRFRSERTEEPISEPNKLTGLIRVNKNNSEPIFKYHPASRVFNSELQVFPNPSTGLINVAGKIEKGATLRVTDVLGRVVYEKQMLNANEMNVLDLTRYGKGLFTVEITGQHQIETKKIVIQ